MNGMHALALIGGLAALDLIAVTFLAAIGADIPPELSNALTIIIAAVTGGTAVKGADALAEKRAERAREAWTRDNVA